ncbi:hypothetical protein [Spodoptera cosmioides nucleopolyhedrovirus]|uniref:Uncharacterized protein n=1 Tax=Spodoptera cosmioides nucleopolyhedrovirus TaxID=2605774 RepID=A0A6B7KGP6_9ABAC|nr:hypothetical protein [Spodoptera cosmioides nucleopolyhedrovirus]
MCFEIVVIFQDCSECYNWLQKNFSHKILKFHFTEIYIHFEIVIKMCSTTKFMYASRL